MKPEQALAYAVTLPTVLVGHELADYIAQTHGQARRKAHPNYNIEPDVPYWQTWLANQGHCLTYHAALSIVTAATLRATGLAVRPRRAAAALVLSWVSHMVLDRRWPVEKIMKWTGSGDWYPAGAPLVDQSLHKIFLWAAALLLASGAEPKPQS